MQAIVVGRLNTVVSNFVLGCSVGHQTGQGRKLGDILFLESKFLISLTLNLTS
jgi:hypothetical protein